LKKCCYRREVESGEGIGTRRSANPFDTTESSRNLQFLLLKQLSDAGALRFCGEGLAPADDNRCLGFWPMFKVQL
jgi:hypothetical protein